MNRANEKRIIFLDPKNIRLNDAPTNEKERYRLLLLSESIRENGLIIPVTVKKSGREYFAVGGEKRIRASILANVKKIPCVLGCNIEAELYRAVENFGVHYTDAFYPADSLYTLIKKYGADRLACVLALSTKELISIAGTGGLSDSVKKKLKEEDVFFNFYEKLYSLEEKDKKDFIEEVSRTIKNSTIKEKEVLPKKKTYLPVIKDKRFYINSIRKAIDNMKQSGINAVLTQNENSKSIEIKIKIPKDSEDELQLSLLGEGIA